MSKFVFIGAGSLDFTRDLVRDILTFPAFDDCEFALVDINEKRLEYARKGTERLIAEGGHHATVTATTDRREALPGADGVLITVLQGGVGVWRHDIEIPKKYGVDICVGDTRGPSGIFRFLRTAPVLLSIIRDVEELCPEAVVLNYTNPMAMLVSFLQTQTDVSVTGLCHSVQGTAQMLARWLGIPAGELSYTCSGINHQAFYLELTRDGVDQYPALREAVLRPEIASEEPVRVEMFKNLGYFPTESSGHNSEYNAWFRKRPDLIEKYCTHGTNWNPGEYAYILNSYLEREDTWKKDIDEWLAQDTVDISRGHEYAAWIFNAVFGDNEMYEFNGNVRNFGLIDNLPQGACVEVPVVASKAGLRAIHVGELPPQLAILNNISSRCEELAIEGSLTGDREKIYQAIIFDPLTSAVLSLQEIRSMVDEMFAANEAYLPQFQKK